MRSVTILILIAPGTSKNGWIMSSKPLSRRTPLRGIRDSSSFQHGHMYRDEKLHMRKHDGEGSKNQNVWCGSSRSEALNKRIVANMAVIETFQPREFIAKRLFENRHLQTILGSGAIEGKLELLDRDFAVTRQRVETPDRDFFDMDLVNANEDANETVIILHGLESGPEAPTVTRMAKGFLSKGLKVVIMAHRGCSGEDNDTPGAYNVGFTDDLDVAIEVVRKKFPSDKLFLSGFSLGANIVLKFLGEQGDKVLDRNICGAAVFCVPFDPLNSQPSLDSNGFNQMVYSKNFLSSLIKKAERQYEKLGKDRVPFDIEKVKRAKTVGEFDDAFIAPIYNFRDKEHYYTESGSKQFLCKIVVPVVAINAKDDPFIPEMSLPTKEDVGNAPVKLVYHNNGGHCGFLHSSLLDTKLESMKQKPIPDHGFIAEEMSRAIQHMRDNLNDRDMDVYSGPSPSLSLAEYASQDQVATRNVKEDPKLAKLFSEQFSNIASDGIGSLLALFTCLFIGSRLIFVMLNIRSGTLSSYGEPLVSAPACESETY